MNVYNLLNGIARRAAHTDRYSTRAVNRRESVAEHQWHSVFYALVISIILNDQGVKIDTGLVVVRCAVHDLEETGTGDVQRSVKHSSPKFEELMDELGEKVVIRIDEELGLPVGSFAGIWKNAKDQSPEGEVVRVADAMSVVAYLVEEMQLGNRTESLMEVVEEVTKYLPTVHAQLTIRQLKDFMSDTINYFRGVSAIR